MKSNYFFTKVFYLLFSLGLILLLGSLFSFIVLNFFDNEPSVESVYWQRLYVALTTYWITIPGLCLTILGTGGLLIKDHPLSKVWSYVVCVVLGLLVINTALIIVPAVNAVNDLSFQQYASGQFIENYSAIKSREDGFGAVNLFWL